MKEIRALPRLITGSASTIERRRQSDTSLFSAPNTVFPMIQCAESFRLRLSLLDAAGMLSVNS